MALDGLDREHVYDLFEKAVKDYICKFPVRFFEASAASPSGGLSCPGPYCEVSLLRKESVSLAVRRIGVCSSFSSSVVVI